MSKTPIIAVIACVIGAVAGALGTQTLLARGDDTNADDTSVATAGLDDARLTALEERLEQARSENAALRARLEALQTPIETTDVAVAPEDNSVDLSRVFGALAPDDKNVAEHLAEEALEAAEEERRAAWRARREEWSNNFRGGMQDFLDASYAAATNDAERERINDLGNYGEALFDLRRQMSEAATDEERAALGQAMRENFDGMRTLMQEQQDHMLRETLDNAGINKPREQNRLMRDLRETMDSPFFRYGGGGGGFGGPRGGPGGGRGGR